MKIGDRYRSLRIPTRVRFAIDHELIERQRKAKARLDEIGVDIRALRQELSEAVRDGKAGEVKRLTRLCFALPKQTLLNKCSDSTPASSEKEV